MLADPVAAMIGDIEPDLDLRSLSTRIPRYVLSALDVIVGLNKRNKQQQIVTAALLAYLPEELLNRTYQELYRQPRPKGPEPR